MAVHILVVTQYDFEMCSGLCGRTLQQCISTFQMSWTTFRRDFVLGPTS